MKKEKLCVICDFSEKAEDEKESSYYLRNFKLCRKCTEILKHKEKLTMQCSVCGSQDTKYVEGINKTTGKKWVAYECTESGCVQKEGAFAGKPNRTFASSPKTKSQPVSNSLEKKVDKILAILEANFKPAPSTDESPF